MFLEDEEAEEDQGIPMETDLESDAVDDLNNEPLAPEVRMKLARGSDVSDLDDSWWQYSLITKVCDTAGKVDITPSNFGNL